MHGIKSFVVQHILLSFKKAHKLYLFQLSEQTLKKISNPKVNIVRYGAQIMNQTTLIKLKFK